MSFARALSNAIRAARTPCAVPRYLLSWPVTVLFSAALVPCAIAQTTTFGSTGNVQTYTVPAGAAGVTILASGAGGGGGGADEAGPGATGGSGAAATGKYPVTGGTVLNVYVGGGGTGGQTSNGAFNCTNSEGAGGSGSGLFAGGAGGNAGCHGWSGGGGGGGGASAVTSGATVILIAGGGGGGQGGSLSSSSVPSQNSTAVGALPGSVGGIGGSFGPSPTLDGGGGGGGGGGCPGGAGGSDHPDSTGTNFGTAAGPGSSCSNASVTGFAITGLGGAGGFGAPGSVYTGGGTGAAGSVSITPYYSATLNASAAFPASVNAGQTVSGTVSLSNQGPSPASNPALALTLPANLSTAPTITGLPAGAGFVYTPATGAVSFTNLPTSLAANATLGPFSVSYLQISSGRSTVLATITSATSDPNPSMRNASATVLGAALQVSGVVFIDAGQTGVYASSDPPVAGATVELVASGRVVATATTNAQGNYFFTSEPAGSYSVALTPRSGFLSSTPAEVPVAISDAGFSTVNFGLIADAAAGTLVVTKTTPLVDIAAGQSVPYTITATNSGKTSLPAVSLADLMPAGFRYRAGSGAVNGHRQEPKTAGRELTWTPLQFAPGEKKTLTLVLTAGAGITGGTFVNSASALNALTHTVISNMATATVRMTGDPTFDCPDLIGKVFDDRNSNGRQDPGEPGIAGVRLVSTQGLLITTDAQGRYHIACPIQPDPSLGTNYELKLDERTLPSGYRLTTDNPGIIRLTAGKLSSLNFGAAVGHVVRIELAGSAFQSNQPGTDLQQRLAALEPLLGQGTSIIRIAYRAADESDATIATRIASVRAAIEGACRARDCPLLPRIEEEIVKPTGETVPGGSP